MPGPAPAMPPGTFTDYAAAPTDSTLNILLLDSLNTPTTDQNYYNLRVRDFLSRLRPGSAVAIFSLGPTLRLLQGFTTDHESLRAAVNTPRNRSSPLLASAADGVNRADALDQAIAAEAEIATPTSFNDGLALVAAESSALQLRTRVDLSIAELSTLARYLSGVPGRKNLVWATGGFPLSINPTIGGGFNSFHEVTSFEPQFRNAVKLLAQSQTAVYTIEPQGLVPPPSGDVRNAFTNAAAAAQADSATVPVTADIHGMMNMIADETGGRAYYYSNAVGDDTRRAIDEGSSYYTLAFVPAASDKKQDFHQLSVKLAREGYSLRYRRGYYPETPAAVTAGAPEAVSPQVASLRLRATALNEAMGHGLPGTAQILYKVRILPAAATPEAESPQPVARRMVLMKPPFRRLLVDFAADPRDLSFTRGEDGNYLAHLRFVTLLYLPDGRLANRVSNAIDTTLTPAGYAALRQTGFGYHQEISVPEMGEYSLRTGIQDLTSGRIGSVEAEGSHPFAGCRLLRNEAGPARRSSMMATTVSPEPPSPMRHAVFLAIAALCVLAAAGAQQASPPLQTRGPEGQPAITTIRARAKLVVVDVVVTGQNHKPYKGLTQADFSLTEGGVPQSIKSFEEHTGLSEAEALKFPPLPTLPPGVFTNYQPAPINSAVNVLLLDALNTPLKDQAFVRDQLLDYVKKAKPGTSVAIFGLTTRLTILQGFTSSPEVLREAVKRSSGKSSPLLDDQVGDGMNDVVSDQLAAYAPDVISAAAGVSNLESLQQSFQLQLRAQYTLDAMSVLARYLSNIPGRKNLIWFSGSFPLDLLPGTEATDPFLAVAGSEKEYRDTINELARSQVAVYPIDARGLMALPMFSASTSGAKYVKSPVAISSDGSKFSSSQAAEHGTMFQMAHDTGGEAFVNTNGLSQAVGKAIDAGSHYYTLTYTPTNSRWNGDYRKIDVKLSHNDYNLSFRRGYYADDPDSPTVTTSAAALITADNRTAARPDSNAMFQAMVHGLPGATQIVYKIRVLPATATPEDTLAKDNLTGAKGFAPVKGPYRRYLVDYAASPHDITFTLGADNLYHCSLEFVTLVYQADGQLAIAQTNQVEASLPPARYKALVNGGLPFHQEISVPVKGDYFIRTGIHDVTGNKIGAVELPVSSVSKLPPPTP